MNYVSYMCSKYYPWFRDLGYPTLDINERRDGSWEIIQYHNIPIIPAETKFSSVLYGIKNELISKSFVEKWCHKLDITRKEYLDMEEAKSRAVYAEHDALEKGIAERQAKAHYAITHNEDLMQRVAKNGAKEMTLMGLLKHIPRYKL